MELIKWTNEMSVGITEIDEQHMQLVKMINDLNKAMNAGEAKNVLAQTISKLMDYAQIHFGTEERFFVQYKYPDKDTHEKEHAEFIGKVFAFKNDFDEGKADLTKEVMKFLSNWLLTHIKGSDLKYKGCFQ